MQDKDRAGMQGPTRFNAQLLAGDDVRTGENAADLLRQALGSLSRPSWTYIWGTHGSHLHSCMRTRNYCHFDKRHHIYQVELLAKPSIF